MARQATYMNPVSMFNKELLPAPEGPKIADSFPRRNRPKTFLRIYLSWDFFLMWNVKSSNSTVMPTLSLSRKFSSSTWLASTTCDVIVSGISGLLSFNRSSEKRDKLRIGNLVWADLTFLLIYQFHWFLELGMTPISS